MKTLKILVAVAALAFAGCLSAVPPATCVVSGTVVDGGAVAVANTPVRFRTIAPTLSGTSGIATQDLTTRTAADGTWSLTLVQGLNAQVDIPAVGIYADTVIPAGALCPAAFTSLTLSARGALTPATILSTTGPSMGGDLTGASPNPSVVGLRSVPLHADTAADGKVWVYRTASSDYRLEPFPVTAAVQSVTAGQGITVTGTTTPTVAVTNGGVVAGMLASGAASSNVGGLGGVLAGSLPVPAFAAGAIVNADVNASAGIAWTKVSKFGAVASDVGALAAGSVIATINASVETPKIAAAQLAGGIAESQVTGLVSDLAAKRATADAIPQADVTGLVAALAAKEATANKGAVSGYAGLDSGGKVPAAQLPATVLADGDKGDVTVSAGGTAFAIDANAVTYAKLQAVSAPDRVLGALLAGNAVEIPFTAAARALADDTDASAMRSTLGLGTASTLNVAAVGDAAAGEVVKGSDTRLADARTPVTHTHVESQVTGLVTDLAAKVDDSTVITTTAPLTIDGGASADLSAGRTLAISGATTGARGAVRLAGDLAGTADSPSVAAVGGTSAANVASGVALALAATDAATPSTIVKRTAGGAATLDVVGNVTGNTSGTAANITGVAAVANGGTGQATATAGFDALAPSSTKGDLIGHDGATSVRVGVGTDGQILTADTASAAGWKWGTVVGTGTVTNLATGNGLQGGPITTTGTVDLKLLAAGGLSKTLGTGSELGIATGGVTDAMLATPVVPQARTISTTAPLTGGGALTGNLTLSVSDAAAGSKGVVQLAGDISGTAAAPTVATVGGETAANVAAGAVLANAATAVNTASAIVRRDGSGNFAGGTFSGNVTGNITGNASGSAASFTGALAGDVTGTQGATVVGKVNGVALSGLATGILKNTTGTGAPSIAVAGTDYQAVLVNPVTGSGVAGRVALFDGAQSVSSDDDLTFDGTTLSTQGMNVLGGGMILTPIGPPPSPSIAAVNAGAKPAGDWNFKVTWTTPTAETGLSAASATITADGTKAITVSRPGSPPALATGWRVYSSKSGPTGTWWVSSGVIALATLTYDDNAADAALTQLGGQNASAGRRILFGAYRGLELGTSNLFFGEEAGRSVTFGGYLAGIGTAALYSATTAVNTVAIGYGAARLATTSSTTTAIGALAGYVTGSSPSAANAVTTASAGTFIGYGAGLGSATQRSNATAIGSGAYVDADNTVVLGNAAVTSVLGGATSGATFRGAAHESITTTGALWRSGSVSETTTIAAAANTDTVITLPANSVIRAVVGKVTVAPPGTATMSVGDPTTAARFAAGVSTVLNTTFVGLSHVDQTGAAGPKQTTAAAVRFTPNVVPSDATGRVSVTIYYDQFTAPST